MKRLGGFREHGAIAVVLVSLVVVTTLALAACSGSCTPSSGATSATPAASTSAPPTASRLNLPTDEVMAAIEGRLAAWMRKDWQGAASYYAEDGAMIEMDRYPPASYLGRLTPYMEPVLGVATVGREDLATALEAIYAAGLRVKSAGLPLQYDRYVAVPARISWGDGSPDTAFMGIYEMDADNKFAYQWVFASWSSRLPPPSSSTSPTPTPVAQLTSRPNVPSREIMRLLEGRIAAMNRGDGEAAAGFHAVKGVMIEIGGLYRRAVTQGSASIAVRLRALFDQGVRLEPAGLPIQYDSLVAEPVRFSNADGSETGAGMLVFDVNAHHKITWQWVIGAPWLPDE